MLLLSFRLYYFSLHDDYPPLLYTAQSIYIAPLPFLINWNEKRCSKSTILTMEHELVLENSNSAAVYTLPNSIIYLNAIRYLNSRLRQIYQTDLELEIRKQKIEDWICCTMTVSTVDNFTIHGPRWKLYMTKSSLRSVSTLQRKIFLSNQIIFPYRCVN